MSLLDFNMPKMDSPEGQGLLAAAFSLMQAKGPSFSNAIGQAGGQYMNTYGQAKESASQAEVRRLQIDAYKQKMEQEKAALDLAKRQRDAASRSIIPAVAATPDKPLNLIGDTGPNLYSTSPSNMVGGGTDAKPASFNHEGYIQELYKMGMPEQALEWQAKIAKDDAPVKLAPGESLFSGKASGYKPLLSVPKAVEQPSAVREYEYAVKQGYKGSYAQWVNESNSSKATRVAVDMRDPTAVAKAAMDFQDKYRAATKPSFQRAQAYESMMAAAQDPSPKGDLTLVYSFVKALDPESVVREGEIDLVNANRSIPDRVKGYANRLATGESLLPHERQDLINQASTLMMTDYNRSRKDIKAYRDNAARLQLDADTYAPDPYANFDPMGVRSRKNGSTSAPVLNLPKVELPDPLGIRK